MMIRHGCMRRYQQLGDFVFDALPSCNECGNVHMRLWVDEECKIGSYSIAISKSRPTGHENECFRTKNFLYEGGHLFCQCQIQILKVVIANGRFKCFQND